MPVVNFRITTIESRVLRKRAEHMGLSLSDYLRWKLDLRITKVPEREDLIDEADFAC